MRTQLALLLVLCGVVAAVTPARGKATAEPTISAFTTDHHYRIDVVAVPNPIPMATYFTLQLAVYDGHAAVRPLSDVSIQVSVGMMHGGHEFMHGMQSSPTVEKHQGRFIVKGMMFHMQGPWTMRVRVREGTRRATADVPLQCCGR
ncbi:MAG TPA: hypothetical protein VMF03_10100 [Steroidobacteraceae bacterium]|nr:hypothetical protein [Steroidobacteraceae bacterium]